MFCAYRRLLLLVACFFGGDIFELYCDGTCQRNVVTGKVPNADLVLIHTVVSRVPCIWTGGGTIASFSRVLLVLLEG